MSSAAVPEPLPAGAPAGPAPGRPEPASQALRLVGVASSAGGLEALCELLEALPETDRLSYVIAQHVSPTHASHLVDLLAPHTARRVLSLQSGQVPAAGAIYVTPPNHNAVLVEGRLLLVEPKEAGGNRPSANHLFQSMAEGLGENAIGIVLSGTGSDGATGLRDIKAAGGVTIAQDPASATHDGMPKAAIRTGSVDLVLRPKDMGAVLLRLANHDSEGAVELEKDGDLYAQVAHLVRARTAFRLDEYKAGTVRRRIARRLGILNLPSLADYVNYLRDTPAEAQQLVRDTFISVTSFFRDTEAYRALERAIGALVRDARSGVLRCWVPGCATGEEAYSIAMLFEEALRVEQRADLQYLIFASDLDDDALDIARSATYALHALEELPQPLRDRYVEAQGHAGRVLKRIRNRIVFARQNLIDDPPFSRIDLISCRNLMIYLNPSVQRRVLEVFHYALRPGGQLFLGLSESADARTDLFTAIDSRARLYGRREGLAHYALPRSQLEGRVAALPRPDSARRNEANAELVSQMLQDQLVQRYAPPSLVISETGRIVHFQGALKPFLDFPSGRAEMNLFDMVEPDIRAELRAQVYRTRRDHAASTGAEHRRPVEGVPHQVRVHVEPLERDKGLMMVSFLAQPDASTEVPEPTGDGPDAAIIAELEQELATARTHLNVVVDELATTNEELQSLAKELQCANEELQSSNEELQTSNEELQSTNEELQTSNEELQAKSAELEAAAALLTNVKQSLDFPLLVVDEQRRILDANSACADLVYHDGPLQGLSFNALPWRFPIADVERELRDVLASGQRGVWPLPGDAGRQYLLHLMPFRPLPARVTGVVMLFENVTAVNQAQAARLESDSRYRQVTESLPQLVWTCVADGPCDYLSPQWVQYTGVPEAQQLGFGWLDQLHPDDRQRAIDHWTKTAHQGLDFEIEFRIRRHDGVYRWFHTLAKPVRNADGTIVKWFGSNTDIDDRKRAEDQIQELNATLEQRVADRTAELLRASEALSDTVRRQLEQQHTLRRILTAAPMAVRIARVSDHRVVFLNQAYAELVKRSPEEALQLEVSQFYADPAAFADIARRLGEGETVRNQLVELRRPEDPEDRAWALASFMVVDHEGEPSVLAWLFDVTELQIAKRAAEDASQTKSRFLANMSHEIRTPMNGVIGMIDMARQGLDDPLRRDRLDKASQSAHRLLAILNDILDLSKIEAGHMRLNLVPTELGTSLENTRLLYEHAAQQKGLRLVVELAPELAPRVVLADVLRLGQVLDNLVNNAIKFSSHGTVRLRAMPLAAVAGDGPLWVRFEVVDQGQGITLDNQARVFNVFEQVDSSSTRTQGGTGLGLTICRRLVAMMGGEIGVHSVPGEGSTFWFTGRFGPTTAAPAQPAPPDINHAATLRSRHSGACVLVAEDEPINQEVETSLLEDLGLQVELVSDGEQAVQAAARRRFDLIFMDMQMPKLNGLDATRAIRGGGPNQHTVIVALTANAFEEDRQRCLDAGMTDFLTKPMSVEELPKRLLAWLDRTAKVSAT